MARFLHNWTLIDVIETAVALALALLPPWLCPAFEEPRMFFLPVMHLMQVALHISATSAQHWWLWCTVLLDGAAATRVIMNNTDVLLRPADALDTSAATVSMGEILAVLVPLTLINISRFIMQYDDAPDAPVALHGQPGGDVPKGYHAPARAPSRSGRGRNPLADRF